MSLVAVILVNQTGRGMSLEPPDVLKMVVLSCKTKQYKMFLQQGISFYLYTNPTQLGALLELISKGEIGSKCIKEPQSLTKTNNKKIKKIKSCARNWPVIKQMIYQVHQILF